MKNWTKKFLNEELKCENSGDWLEGGFENNKRNAKKLLGISEELWSELSNQHFKLLRNIDESLDNSEDNIKIKILTSFLASVSVGWAEKNNKIK